MKASTSQTVFVALLSLFGLRNDLEPGLVLAHFLF